MKLKRLTKKKRQTTLLGARPELWLLLPWPRRPHPQSAMPGRVDPITGSFVRTAIGEAPVATPVAARLPQRVAQHSRAWDDAHRYQTTTSAIGAHLQHASAWGREGENADASFRLPLHRRNQRSTPLHQLNQRAYSGRLDDVRAGVGLDPRSGHTFLKTHAFADIMQTTRMRDSSSLEADGLFNRGAPAMHVEHREPRVAETPRTRRTRIARMTEVLVNERARTGLRMDEASAYPPFSRAAEAAAAAAKLSQTMTASGTTIVPPATVSWNAEDKRELYHKHHPSVPTDTHATRVGGIDPVKMVAARDRLRDKAVAKAQREKLEAFRRNAEYRDATRRPHSARGDFGPRAVRV